MNGTTDYAEFQGQQSSSGALAAYNTAAIGGLPCLGRYAVCRARFVA